MDPLQLPSPPGFTTFHPRLSNAIGAIMNAWLPQSFDPRGREHRVLCFPHAGGGAAIYHRWNRELHGVELVPINLPGRESRIDHRPADNLEALLRKMVPAIERACDAPFSIFGYSMGALIGFELARQFRASGARMPDHMFVAASRAPQLPLGRDPLHQLSDDAMLDELVESYGMAKETSPQERALMKMMSDTLRADLKLFETYKYEEQPPLDVPITAFGGSNDPQVTRAKLEAWKAQTATTFKSRFLPGHHFFLRKRHQSILDAISSAVG